MKKVMLGGRQVTFRTKISNSKKELARIISENGGWIAGSFASQQDDGEVWFSAFKPKWKTRCGTFDADYEGHFTIGHLIANRHQTILSRDEYFHLYPAPDAEVSVYGDSTLIIPGDPLTAMRRMQDSLAFDAGPTIEQLATDYRNAKDYAERKQQEADDAKADADEALRKLELAGESLGLLVSPITTKEESELVINDWRDLRVGDEVDANYRGIERVVGAVLKIDAGDSNRPIFVSDGERSIWATEFKFIRRP